MTIATDLGFKVGESYVVDIYNDRAVYTLKGDILEFVRDDHTNCPQFNNTRTRTKVFVNLEDFVQPSLSHSTTMTPMKLYHKNLLAINKAITVVGGMPEAILANSAIDLLETLAKNGMEMNFVVHPNMGNV
jgi:hypothetical protein